MGCKFKRLMLQSQCGLSSDNENYGNSKKSQGRGKKEGIEILSFWEFFVGVDQDQIKTFKMQNLPTTSVPFSLIPPHCQSLQTLNFDLQRLPSRSCL